MDLDTFHEHMQDAQDIQDLLCIPALELKWKYMQFCVHSKNLGKSVMFLSAYPL